MEQSLKIRRQEMGKEIEEVARITRIKASYLKAIEEGDFSKLPVAVYARGYIKEYALFLGVPVDQAFAPYEQFLETKGLKTKATALMQPGDKKTIKMPTTEKSYDETARREQPETAKIKLRRTAGRGPDYRKMLYAVPLILAIMIVYSLIPQKKEVQVISPKVEQDLPKPPQEVTTQTDNSSVGSQASSIEYDTSGHVNEAVQKMKHSLEITATDKVWLEVTTDGSNTKEMLLQPGDRVTYEADEFFSLKVGNAGGVKIKYDGREFENLGNKGQVKRLAFPESHLEQSMPAPKEKVRQNIIPSSEASSP